MILKHSCATYRKISNIDNTVSVIEQTTGEPTTYQTAVPNGQTTTPPAPEVARSWPSARKAKLFGLAG